jgi:hypothetical protein
MQEAMRSGHVLQQYVSLSDMVSMPVAAQVPCQRHHSVSVVAACTLQSGLSCGQPRMP